MVLRIPRIPHANPRMPDPEGGRRRRGHQKPGIRTHPGIPMLLGQILRHSQHFLSTNPLSFL
jgi:hypothetical protein